jgi:hypothetical protein
VERVENREKREEQGPRTEAEIEEQSVSRCRATSTTVPVLALAPGAAENRMALHFVSTSVLSSTESGGYSEELKGDDDEVHLAQVNALKSVGRPLHEQLAEQAMRKQAEYDANTKLIFG